MANDPEPFRCWECDRRVPIEETYNMRCPECVEKKRQALRERYADAEPLPSLDTA